MSAVRADCDAEGRCYVRTRRAPFADTIRLYVHPCARSFSQRVCRDPSYLCLFICPCSELASCAPRPRREGT
jgi:hypothetical protein